VWCSGAGCQGLHGQREIQREFGAAVALQLTDGKGHRLAKLAEESEATSLVQVPVQTQHAKSGAVVERGVLKAPLPVHPHEFDVELDRVAGLIIRK